MVYSEELAKQLDEQNKKLETHITKTNKLVDDLFARNVINIETFDKIKGAINGVQLSNCVESTEKHETKRNLITHMRKDELWIWRKSGNNNRLITHAKYLSHDDQFLQVEALGRTYMIRWEDIQQIEAPPIEPK